MTALLLAILSLPPSIAAAVPPSVPVYLTAYTCVHHPNNAMTTTEGMCQATYTGGRVDIPGAACPREMIGQMIVWNGYVLACDDLPYHEYWDIAEAGNASQWVPHIDVRFTEEMGGYWGAMETSAGVGRVWIVPVRGQERKGA